MTAQVTHHPAGVTRQPLQWLAHPADRFGLSVATDLQSRSRGEAGTGLAQFYPRFLCQDCQVCRRPLVKPGVSRVGDGLFHHRRIDGNALDAGVVDHPRFASGLDGPGQPPRPPSSPIRLRQRVSEAACRRVS